MHGKLLERLARKASWHARKAWRHSMACTKTYGHSDGVAHRGVDHVERGVECGVEGVVGAQARAQDCEEASEQGGGAAKVMQSSGQS